MNDIQIAGAVLLGLGLLQAVVALWKSSLAFEWAAALFFGEFGLLLLLGQLAPDKSSRIVVSALFAAAMVATAVTWYRLFRKHSSAGSGPNHQ